MQHNTKGGIDHMTFKDAISTCFRKYADFSGRARRSEYWYFWLLNLIVAFVLTIVLGEGSLIASLYSLVTLVPGLAVGWRRMHDIGKSGAWIFLSLVPLVGAIIVIIWLAKDSQPGSNAFGPNPKNA